MYLHTILFDHDDLDAAGVAICFSLAHQHMQNETQIIFCSNDNKDQKVQEALNQGIIGPDTIILFGDICPTRPMLERLVKQFNRVHVIDHHRTNMYAMEVIPTATVIPEINGKMESGTSLMFRYFMQLAQEMPDDERGRYFSGNPDPFFMELVDTIRSYDTYEWKSTNNVLAKRLQTLYGVLGMERFCEKYIKRIINRQNVRHEDTGELIEYSDAPFIDARIDQEQRSIDSIGLDNVNVMEIHGYQCAVRFSTGGMNISELSHQFLSKYPEIDVFIGIDVGRGEFSFRTVRDDLDTGALFAKPIEAVDKEGNKKTGGGHPKASGAPISEEVRLKIMELLVEVIDPDAPLTNVTI